MVVKQKRLKSTDGVVDGLAPVSLLARTEESGCNKCCRVFRDRKTMEKHQAFHKVVTVTLPRVIVKYC